MQQDRVDADTIKSETKTGGRDSQRDEGCQENADNSLRHSPSGGQNSKAGDKTFVPGGSDQPLLLAVLSDPLTGLLMDDAMVAQCGHSFGLRSLQRVLETNICMSCGALVPPETLIPNYALRAAVEAYGREESMAHKVLRPEQLEQPEVSVCKIASKPSLAQQNCSNDSTNGGFHFKVDQDAVIVDDHVIIKGDEHIPVHFVCREAVITAKSVDGWYTVKTVDSGESITLPYRFLQKVQGNEIAFDVDSGSCLGQVRDVIPKNDASDVDKAKWTTINGQTSSNSCHELPLDEDDSKSLGKDVPGNECENSEGEKGVSLLGEMPLESNQGGGGVDDFMGVDHFSPEGASGHSGGHTDIHETKRSKRGRGGGGLQIGGILGTQAGLDVMTVRSKRSSLVTRASKMRNGSCTSSGPHRKAYISNVRKHSCTGDETSYFPLVDKTRELSSPNRREAGSSKSREFCSPNTRQTNEIEDVKFNTSNAGNNQVLHMIKKGMANLEKDIPWMCFQRVWRKQRSLWRKGLRDSSSIQELGIKLQELRSSLLLASAGGMPDDEWEKQLNIAKESENTDLLIYLWRNFNDDVSKWMTAKSRRSQVHMDKRIEDDEYADLKKLFPTLVIEGFSPAGVTAAAAIAAAEAFSDEGSKNTEVLLKVPMKLIRQHNHHDLIVLRDALEREKRHISAKLAVLEKTEYNIMNGFGESAGSDQSMDTKPCRIFRHVPDTVDTSIMSYPFFKFHGNVVSQELQMHGDSAQCKFSEYVNNGTRCKSS